MKSNKFLYVILLAAAAVIIAIVILDYRAGRPGRRGINPYEYDMDSLGLVDPALVGYDETAHINIDARVVRALDYRNGRIYVLADNYLLVMDRSGTPLFKKDFDLPPRCLFVESESSMIIGFDNFFILMDGSGNITLASPAENTDARFTAIAADGSEIYVADAGNRLIWVYNYSGVRMREIEGVSTTSSQHGFIIPSQSFDLAISPPGDLWVSNPGIHTLQQYSRNGDLMAYWGKASVSIEGFNGCCNPAHITFLPEGDMVTSEKHLVRIKIYDISGNLKSVVATTQQFANDSLPPDIAADEQGNIMALDLSDKMVRFFKPR